MKYITVSNKKIMVDNEDYEWLHDLRGWIISSNGRVQLNLRKGGLLNMARMIMFAPEDMVVDHIDGNPLNNQKSNLRLCTRAQNSRNRPKNIKRKATSKYKGVYVYKHPNGRTYIYARIKSNYKNIHLGYFKNELDAARAYDAMAKELFGEYANLNFK